MNDDLNLEPLKRLSKDLAVAAKTLSDQEARYLVDAYYQMQEDRKRSDNQVLSLGEAEPNSVLLWLGDQSSMLEKQIARALDKYTENHLVGSWMRGVYGIGPVIAAGLLAHISMEPWRCRNPDAKKSCKSGAPCTSSCGKERIETAGHIWRYAGLDPTQKWEREQKRPWNAQLKTLCWKVGQSFMKFSNKPECVYGHLYKERKAYEIQRNESGGNAETAKILLPKFSKSTEAHKYLSEGKLPPAQIDARARRWTVKIFLSHLHEVWYTRHFGKSPPAPYPIAILGHSTKIEPQQ